MLPKTLYFNVPLNMQMTDHWFVRAWQKLQLATALNCLLIFQPWAFMHFYNIITCRHRSSPQPLISVSGSGWELGRWSNIPMTPRHASPPPSSPPPSLPSCCALSWAVRVALSTSPPSLFPHSHALGPAHIVTSGLKKSLWLTYYRILKCQ